MALSWFYLACNQNQRQNLTLDLYCNTPLITWQLGKTSKKKNSKKKGFVRKGGEVSEKDQIGEQLNKSDIRGGENFFQDLS